MLERLVCPYGNYRGVVNWNSYCTCDQCMPYAKPVNNLPAWFWLDSREGVDLTVYAATQAEAVAILQSQADKLGIGLYINPDDVWRKMI